AAEGRFPGPAPGGGRGGGHDPARAARSALADPGAGLRAHRPARSEHGGRAPARGRPGGPARGRRRMSFRGEGETLAARVEDRKENRESLKAALGRQPVVAAVDLGASKVACFIMKPEGVRRADRTLTTAGVGYVQSRGVRGGTIVNLDEASEAIAQAVERAENVAGVSVQGVTVSTAGGQLAS